MKKFLSIMLSAAMLSASAVAMAADEITVTVNDVKVYFPEQEPFIENDFTLVPMRAIFEALGASVEWDDDTKTVLAYDDTIDTSVVLQIGSDTMFVNNEAVKLEVTAKVVNDRTVVPVRAIAEGLKCKVDWEQETLTVKITRENQTEMPNPWTDYESMNALNSAINEKGDVKFQVADIEAYPTNLMPSAYRYLEENNMAEVEYIFEASDFLAEVTVRTAPGDADISGVMGAEKVSDFMVNESLVEVYKLDDIYYAAWTCSNVGLMSHSVVIAGDSESFPEIYENDTEIIRVLKDIATNLESTEPRG